MNIHEILYYHQVSYIFWLRYSQGVFFHAFVPQILDSSARFRVSIHVFWQWYVLVNNTVVQYLAL